MGKRTGSSEATGLLSSDGEHSSSFIISPSISASNSTSSADGGLSGGPFRVDMLVRSASVGGDVTAVRVRRKKSRKTRLVAVKMTPHRAPGFAIRGKEDEEEERTRVGFVREVEILKVSNLGILLSFSLDFGFLLHLLLLSFGSVRVERERGEKNTHIANRVFIPFTPPPSLPSPLSIDRPHIHNAAIIPLSPLADQSHTLRRCPCTSHSPAANSPVYSL